MESPAACYPPGEICATVSCLLVMLLGVPGNGLILRVYWRKPRKTSTNTLIMGLAAADLAASACLVFTVASSCLLGVRRPAGYVNATNYPTFTAVASSVVLTGVIAFDRYDCVCRPHQRRLLNGRRADVAVLCSVIFCALINLPLIVEIFSPSPLMTVLKLSFQVACYLSALVMIVACYGRVYAVIRAHVKVGVGVERGPNDAHSTSDIQTSPTGITRADNSSVSATALRPLPTSTSSQVAVIVTRASPDNAETPSSIQRQGTSQLPLRQRPPTVVQKKTTRMLLITSVVFLVSWLPRWAYVAVLFLDREGSVVPPTLRLAISIASVTVYFNHAVNPLIYGIANSRFRKACKDELRKCRCR